MPLTAPRGVVATSQPLAVQAGLSMLQAGGSAVDAVLATAITLTLVEPTSNGLGSDAFAIVWDGARLQGMNASGRSPAGTSVDAIRAAGHTTMPPLGWWPVNVPGAVRGWADLHARYGRLPFAQLFEPAIYYAEHGFPVSPIVAYFWERGRQLFEGAGRPEFKSWFDTFTPGGRAPKAGEVFCSPAHAETLRRIAASKSVEFYEGELAERTERFARETGGTLTAADLAAHHTDWVQPISARYRGHEVWEIPPNGQGIAALMALNILEGLPVASSARETVEAYHLQIEALKLGLTDAMRYVADPEHADIPVQAMLDTGYAAERRKLIGERALDPLAGSLPRGGTVYLCAADADGMMISYIQSNYQGFGSGMVVPGTGIALHNRGNGFVLDEGHPNQVAPRKRPYHTIIPGFLTREGQPVGPFGVMGAFMQTQGHVQVMVNTHDFDMNPQAALDAPRWQWMGGKTVIVEDEADPTIIAGLRERGHDVRPEPVGGIFGRGQIIWRLPGGGYVAASDKRADGYAAGY